MSNRLKWLWICLASYQCLCSIVASAGGDDRRTPLDCDRLDGPTVTIVGQMGRETGRLDGRLDWRDPATGERRSCRPNALTDRPSGVYRVRVRLPACTAADCSPTLRLRTALRCWSLPLDELLVGRPAEDGEYHVPIWSYGDCRTSRTDKREWAGDDMQWLKRTTAAAADDWDPMNDGAPFGYNKKFDAHTMNWLRKRAPEYPWLQKKPTWTAGGANWLRKRAWNKANAEWLKRGWRHDADMGWLKRGWSSGDVQWLKRSEPYRAAYGPEAAPDKRWDHGEIMDWLKKRSVDDVAVDRPSTKRAWEDAHTEWIKRDAHGSRVHSVSRRDASSGQPSGDDLTDLHADPAKKNWGASGMSWIKRHRPETRNRRNWGASGMSWIKRDPDEAKRNWGASGMSWIKRNDADADDHVHANDDDKRNWGASGMSWIKRDPDQEKRNWGASGMSWIKRHQIPDKKTWGASGMSWIKRGPNDDDKRNWGASGMSWIKRDDSDDVDDVDDVDDDDDDDVGDDETVANDADDAYDINEAKRNWGASGMSWIKRHHLDLDKKNWGASGMSWIKRGQGEPDKRNWGASGMSWIKRLEPDADKRNWGASGMSWIKRANPAADKKNWGASGMSWIKRGDGDGDKRNWGASGMSWIKRDPDQRDKKNWGASGMSWIKRDDNGPEKKNWGASGMSWIKRDPEERDKKNWGASGMSWIKRDGGGVGDDGDDDGDEAKNSVQDKSSAPRAWKTLKQVIDSKIVPPLHVRSWPRESDWLKRSGRRERHAKPSGAGPAPDRAAGGAETSDGHRVDAGEQEEEAASQPLVATPLTDDDSSSEAH